MLLQIHHIHDMSNILDSLPFALFRTKQMLMYFVYHETIYHDLNCNSIL